MVPREVLPPRSMPPAVVLRLVLARGGRPPPYPAHAAELTDKRAKIRRAGSASQGNDERALARVVAQRPQYRPSTSP